MTPPRGLLPVTANALYAFANARWGWNENRDRERTLWRLSQFSDEQLLQARLIGVARLAEFRRCFPPDQAPTVETTEWV